MGYLHIPSQPRKLFFNEKGQLVDKLLDCPKMRDRHARDMVVQELSFAGSIPRHEADKDDVRNILSYFKVGRSKADEDLAAGTVC